MTWAELADDLSSWTIPRAARRMASPTSSRFRSRCTRCCAASRGKQGSDLVFPGLRGPFNGFGKAKAQLDKTSGVTGWRLHDLRRTMATGLQRLGVRLEVTESVLNHVSGSRATEFGRIQGE